MGMARDAQTQVLSRAPWYSPSRIVGTLSEARRYPVLPISILLVVLIIPACFAELIAPHDPIEGGLGARLIPPFWSDGGSTEHILGTDKVGRDILSRMIYGSRISVIIAGISIIVGTGKLVIVINIKIIKCSIIIIFIVTIIWSTITIIVIIPLK